MIPLHWKWRDLGRAIKAARWAFYHADDLTMLKHELNAVDAGWEGMTRQNCLRARHWLAQRFLGSLPIK